MSTPSKFFLPYQAKWIRDSSRLKLMQKSRQIGISWSSAYEDVRNASAAEARHDVWVSSRDEIQARLYLEDCKAFAKILNLAANDLGERIIDEDRKIAAYVLQFANGRRIHSMSSNPDAQAGKRGHRKLDEFALNPEQKKLYSIAYPGITWGGSLAIISTHRGSQSYFSELVQECLHKGNPKGWSLHTVTLTNALEQGFLAKLKAKLPADDERQGMDESAYFDFIRAGCADEETFQQEYMCVPSDDATAFLSYDLIAGCEYPATELWETPLELVENPLYVGVDVGRVHDLTVIWVFERVLGMLFTRAVIELENTPFDAQEDALYRILSHPRMLRCCIDNTGIGRQFAERAQKRFGKYRVEPITFTPAMKEELAYPVRAAFEDKTVRIPGDPRIRADLRSIKKETTSSGNVRFAADRGKNGHADRFWGLALAKHAAKSAGERASVSSIARPLVGARRLRRSQGVLV